MSAINAASAIRRYVYGSAKLRTKVLFDASTMPLHQFQRIGPPVGPEQDEE